MMNFIKWMVKKMEAIQIRKQTKKMSVFFKTNLKFDRNRSIGEQSILGRKDYTTRKIDRDGQERKKGTK